MGRACAPSEGLGVQVLSSGPVPPGQTTGSHPHIEPCQGGLSLLLLTSAQPMLAVLRPCLTLLLPSLLHPGSISKLWPLALL